MANRGTGVTSKQMREAPQRAVFIIAGDSSHAMGYYKHLAHHLGRGDLELQAPRWLDRNAWRGRNLTGLVVDHDARLSGTQLEYLEHARARVRPEHANG